VVVEVVAVARAVQAAVTVARARRVVRVRLLVAVRVIHAGVVVDRDKDLRVIRHTQQRTGEGVQVGVQ